MKSYSSREVINILLKDGWYFVGQEGSHRHYEHAIKKGKATVTHPKKQVPIPTLKGIEKQTRLKF